MIYINKDSSNNVILELTLNSNLLSPNYLFQLTNEMTSNETLFTATDLSTFKCRYNRFNIIETGSTFTNLTGGTINLVSGSYNYNIYESSTPTLYISGTTGRIVQTGKAFVNGTDVEIASIYR